MSLSAVSTRSDSLNESSNDRENWKSFFIFSVIENSTECQLCHSKLSGNCDSNNKRHIMTKHPAKAQELGVTVKKRRKGKECEGQESGLKTCNLK